MFTRNRTFRTYHSVPTEIRDSLGNLVGVVSPVPMPMDTPIMGDRPSDKASLQFVGWAHDWDADNLEGKYIPLCLGVSDDPETLFAEIERRAREATS